MIRNGMRVIRGPEWDLSNHEDGGPGHLGTIVETCRKTKVCTVQWDNGNITKCQADSYHQNLRIVYTECTVKNAFSQYALCDSQCKTLKKNILGLRFLCVTCVDYDLCTTCYMADAHDRQHPFVRLDSRWSKVVPVLPRVKSKKIKLYGFGPGAKVMLTDFVVSPHIKEHGTIKELDYNEGIAKVEWLSGGTSTQNVGKDGMVDIKLLETNQTGRVYVDHLPLVDLSVPVESCINIGDIVRVDINLETFKGIMPTYGGWNDEMEKIMGETGEVVGFRNNRQCEVYYRSVSRSWMIFPACLTKISTAKVGDRVTVLADVGIVCRRQGQKWQDGIRNYIGKSGIVDSLDEIGNLNVRFPENISYVFSPSCVVKDSDGSSSLGLQSTGRPTADDDESLSLGQPTEPTLDNDRSSSVGQPSEPTVDIEVIDLSVGVTELPLDLRVIEEVDKSVDLNGLLSSESSTTAESEGEFMSSDEEEGPRIINTSLIIAAGLRVVRGRDWRYTDQDGGEGHLGTVTEIAFTAHDSCTEKCATVRWDNGHKNDYRIGYEDCYDLRIYDNAGVAGNRHVDVKCSESTCEFVEDDLMGFYWQSQTNPDYKLCNMCYHDDKGYITDKFLRIDYPGHKGTKVPKRETSKRQKLQGIDEGAKVVRGANWRWANQDGGPGQPGEVIAIVNFSLDTDRDAAEVTWENGHTNVYRLGYEGSVDLECTKPASRKYYYAYHLPELRMPEGEVHVPQPEPELGPVVPDAVDDGRLKPGDLIQIGVDPDILKSIQQSTNNWKDSMVEIIGVNGTVKRVDGTMVTVEFNGTQHKLHEMTLKKVEVFNKGEFVLVSSDFNKVQKLQNGHGDWNDSAVKSFGKKGHVQRVTPDGDVVVSFADATLTYNPECLSKTEGPADKLFDPVQSSTQKPVQKPVQEPIQEPVQPKPVREPRVTFKKAVEEGLLDEVLIYLENQQTLESKQELVRGKSSFHPVFVACKYGHVGVLKAILQYADVRSLEEGDENATPLQIAVKSRKPECVDLLLNYNVNKDKVNDNSQTAVHLAVQNRDLHTLRVLRKHNCDVNKKDALGDTAVVDAIVRQQGDNTELLDIILDWPHINLNFENKTGFSPIHIAARKGDLGAVKSLLKKDPGLLNKKKSDGYTPLHLAACMDHHTVVQYLLEQRNIQIEAQTVDKGQTPLLMACFYVSKKSVEIMLNGDFNCQVDAKDVDENNALHLCLSGPPQVIVDVQRTPHRHDDDKHIKPQIELAQFLVEKGVVYTARNRAGKLPVEIASSDKLKAEFTAFIDAKTSHEQHQLCPLCQDEGNEVYSVYRIQPCECTLCNGCFMPKFRKCPNCGDTVQSFDKLKRK